LKFFETLKKIPGIEEILEVDIDEELISRSKCKAQPLMSDYWLKRPTPLKVKVCVGSVDLYDPLLENTDAVIAIEL